MVLGTTSVRYGRAARVVTGLSGLAAGTRLAAHASPTHRLLLPSVSLHTVVAEHRGASRVLRLPVLRCLRGHRRVAML